MFESQPSLKNEGKTNEEIASAADNEMISSIMAKTASRSPEASAVDAIEGTVQPKNRDMDVNLHEVKSSRDVADDMMDTANPHGFTPLQ